MDPSWIPTRSRADPTTEPLRPRRQGAAVPVPRSSSTRTGTRTGHLQCATAGGLLHVERAFSAMSFVKNKLRNKMGDSLLDDCLVTFIEREAFSKVDENDIIETFMAMKRRKPDT